ncbi:hypothetical protein D3C75_1049230 [compost metagenome]
MQHALLHPQGINKGLEGRARGTLGIGPVHLPLDLAIVIIGRAHQRPYPHITAVHQQHRGIMDPPAMVTDDKRVHLPFDQPLEPGIQRGIHTGIQLH